jgi:hypothetical protein
VFTTSHNESVIILTDLSVKDYPWVTVDKTRVEVPQTNLAARLDYQFDMVSTSGCGDYRQVFLFPCRAYTA